MSLSDALTLAGQGFYMFPCEPNGKLPLVKGWPAKATRDPAKIERWAQKFDGCNWGVFTGRYGDGQGLVVVDVDNKDGKNGNASLVALELLGQEFPATMETATPTGGRHLIYAVPQAVKQGVDVLGTGLDIRSKGGFVLGPGSVINGRAYVVDRPDIPQPAPQWLIDRCGLTPDRPSEATADRRALLARVDPARAVARAIEYLEAQEAVTEGGRNHAAFKVASQLKDLGVPAEQIEPLMLEHWPCEPMLDSAELRVTIASAYRSGNAPGVGAPEAQFSAVPEATSKARHPIDQLNEEWAAVAEPPNTVVYRISRDSATGQTCFSRFTREGFMGLLANQKLDASPLANKWWESPRRRTYGAGTIFAPAQTVPPDYLNTWGGFAVQPAAGDWSQMRAHIRDIICSGDPALDSYVMGWLARLVQHPGEQGHVALVLRGGRGTGKGTLGAYLVKLFGRHGLHVANSQRLTGNFNGHLADKVLVFGDESFYAGRRADESMLKMLVTERMLDLEQKYQSARNVQNCLHILLASNESWVVPAGAQERRFCVIDVSEARQQDTAYFADLSEQMDNGGLAAMLYDLQRWDISTFNVRKVPHTSAGTEQRTDSLRGPERWLFNALAKGHIAGQEWGDECLEVCKAAAFADYEARHRDLGDFQAVAVNSFWPRVTRVLQAGGILPVENQAGSKRQRHRVFPSLSEARAAFDAWLGGVPVDWDSL